MATGTLIAETDAPALGARRFKAPCRKRFLNVPMESLT
jgi:hypothetical protein